MSWRRITIAEAAHGKYIVSIKKKHYLLGRREYLLYRLFQASSALFLIAFGLSLYFAGSNDFVSRLLVLAFVAVITVGLISSAGWKRLKPNELARHEPETHKEDTGN